MEDPAILSYSSSDEAAFNKLRRLIGRTVSVEISVPDKSLAVTAIGVLSLSASGDELVVKGSGSVEFEMDSVDMSSCPLAGLSLYWVYSCWADRGEICISAEVRGEQLADTFVKYASAHEDTLRAPSVEDYREGSRRILQLPQKTIAEGHFCLGFFQRLSAAFLATSRRSSTVMVSKRRFPPILPPLLPIAAITRDISDLDGLGSGSVVERRTIWNAA